MWNLRFNAKMLLLVLLCLNLVSASTQQDDDEGEVHIKIFTDVFVAIAVIMVVVSLNVGEICGIFIGVFVISVIMLSVFFVIRKKKVTSYSMPALKRKTQKDNGKLGVSASGDSVPLVNLYDGGRTLSCSESDGQSHFYVSLDGDNLPPPPDALIGPRGATPPLTEPRSPVALAPASPFTQSPPLTPAPPPPFPRGCCTLPLASRHDPFPTLLDPRDLPPPPPDMRNCTSMCTLQSDGYLLPI